MGRFSINYNLMPDPKKNDDCMLLLFDFVYWYTNIIYYKMTSSRIWKGGSSELSNKQCFVLTLFWIWWYKSWHLIKSPVETLQFISTPISRNYTSSIKAPPSTSTHHPTSFFNYIWLKPNRLSVYTTLTVLHTRRNTFSPVTTFSLLPKGFFNE